MPKLTGYKEIAQYLSQQVGALSERTARAYAARPVDPLPVRAFGNRVIADRAELDVWMKRQWRKRGNVARAAAR